MFVNILMREECKIWWHKYQISDEVWSKMHAYKYLSFIYYFHPLFVFDYQFSLFLQ